MKDYSALSVELHHSKSSEWYNIFPPLWENGSRRIIQPPQRFNKCSSQRIHLFKVHKWWFDYLSHIDAEIISILSDTTHTWTRTHTHAGIFESCHHWLIKNHSVCMKIISVCLCMWQTGAHIKEKLSPIINKDLSCLVLNWMQTANLVEHLCN